AISRTQEFTYAGSLQCSTGAECRRAHAAHGSPHPPRRPTQIPPTGPHRTGPHRTGPIMTPPDEESTDEDHQRGPHPGGLPGENFAHALDIWHLLAIIVFTTQPRPHPERHTMA